MRTRVLLLLSVMVLPACEWDADARVARGFQRTIPGAHPTNAPAAMRKYGCISCHTIPGVAGARAKVGPSLEGVAGRQFIAGRIPNEPDKLMQWIKDAPSLKPNTAMPNMGVTDEDARNIAAYLYGLK